MESKSSVPYDQPPPYPGLQGSGMPPQGYQPGPPQGYQPGPPPSGFQLPPHAGDPGVPPPTQPVTMVTVVPLQNFGPYSIQITCPKCSAQVMTSTKTQAGLVTYLTCGLCILFGCWFGCCLIPFCVNDLQDTEHFCPNCNSYLGVYRRL